MIAIAVFLASGRSSQAQAEPCKSMQSPAFQVRRYDFVIDVLLWCFAELTMSGALPVNTLISMRRWNRTEPQRKVR